jgi:hypothetical protein
MFNYYAICVVASGQASSIRHKTWILWCEFIGRLRQQAGGENGNSLVESNPVEGTKI